MVKWDWNRLLLPSNFLLTLFSLPLGTKRSFCSLSTTWLTGVTTATLPLPYFNEVVAENKIQLFVKWHGN